MACMPFQSVIIDEAAQATEPGTLVPLELAGSKTCILLGDDRQLPPTVFSPEADRLLLSRPLFERLRLIGLRPIMLNEQYRMKPQIASFANEFFYGGQLLNAPPVIWREQQQEVSLITPFNFLDLGSSHAVPCSNSASWRNWEEANLCVKLLSQVLQLYKAEHVGILTPYRAQQEAILDALGQASVDMPRSMVQTVDSAQGKEFEVVIFSSVRAEKIDERNVAKRTGLGFLSDERRLNVALTRARNVLFVLGHSPTLLQGRAFSALIAHAKATDSYHWLRHSSSCRLDDFRPVIEIDSAAEVSS
eukprot:TRINITY_DN57505_c0_g1_i1.p1 TRINITY_DN57505_c0_g1~~TRINITY_DN57505_c0_g1_i1.p1  ORF type:complete len:342 (-),score=44.96 TRINITY_DN57505_c0_g1_i1:99-1010(-)